MTTTQERKFYRVQKNYRNCNMPDQWINIDEVDTLEQARITIYGQAKRSPKEVLFQIVLVLETTITIETDERETHEKIEH